MKKWVSTLILLFVFSLSQGAFAADWRPMDGIKDTFWNAEGLTLMKTETGEVVDGDLVVISIKRPVPPELLKKVTDSVDDAQKKAEVSLAKEQVLLYAFSLKFASFSPLGTSFLTAEGASVFDLPVQPKFYPIPQPDQGGEVVRKLFDLLLSEQKAGRIK